TTSVSSDKCMNEAGRFLTSVRGRRTSLSPSVEAMLGPALLSASRSPKLRKFVSTTKPTKRVVDRVVAGENLDQAMTAVADLASRGIGVTLDHLGEGVTSEAGALASRDAYLRALEALGNKGYGTRAEVSVKLSAFGQELANGHDLALANVTPV